MQIALRTHTDLDGLGCAILAKQAFGDFVDIEYCTPNDINDSIEKLLLSEEAYEYDIIFITDLSVNESVAEKITNFIDSQITNLAFSLGSSIINTVPYRRRSTSVVLLDHHATAEWLNKYSWATVSSNNEDRLECGTSLFFSYISKFNRISYRYSFINAKLVELIRRYDTWEWQTKYKDNTAKDLNDLLSIYGRERFIKKFVDSTDSSVFSVFDSQLLEIEREKIKAYIDKKRLQMKEVTILNHPAGLVVAERYTSELGHILAEENKHLDFITIIRSATEVSYRTIHDTVDVSEIAEHYNGGGHKKSAGSPITEDTLNKCIQLIFNQRVIDEDRWECEKSPTGYCEYDKKDICHDTCKHCGEPEERK